MPSAQAPVVRALRHRVGNVEVSLSLGDALLIDRKDDKIFRLDSIHVITVGHSQSTPKDVGPAVARLRWARGQAKKP